MSYKYSAFYLPIKGFCDYHETPLTTTQGLFKKRNRRKTKDTPLTITFVKNALACLSQRDRAISMIQLQAGQAIKQVLVDVNAQARRIFHEIDSGAERIRFDFDERKGNGFQYFSFISRDAIQEIQKWRQIREKILDELGIKSDLLFITEAGNPYLPKYYHTLCRLKYIHVGLYKGPLSVRSHGFRKFFEQEASPPDRGISKSYITFMMGHSTPQETNDHPLDVVGGVYDGAPRVYPSVVEKEYAKLEPYINIYSGFYSRTKPESDVTSMISKMPVKGQDSLAILGRVLDNNPRMMKKFQNFLMTLDDS